MNFLQMNKKDNPVPSLDDIQVIEDLLKNDGKEEFDNNPIDAYFNGVRNGIITYFEHYHKNGVENNNEQPKVYVDKKTQCCDFKG